MSRRRGPLVPENQDALDKFKEETASELGIKVPKASPYELWGRIPAERCGEIGGSMVKKMIEAYEKHLAE